MEAAQWFPPSDPRHDALVTPVLHLDTDCLSAECQHDDCADHAHGPRPGEIGEQDGKYWCRTSSSSATWLQPGMWIVLSPVYPQVEVLTDGLFWSVYSGPI